MRPIKRLRAETLAALSVCCFWGCVDPTEEPPKDAGTPPETTTPTETENPNQEEITTMYITVNGNKLEVTLAKNKAVDALIEKLRSGDITYTASDYGGFEKVGGLGFSLPRSDASTVTQAGDVVLYSGNQIVIFYGSNSWSYTRLGKINKTADELRVLLGAGSGDVQVTLSLN